MELFPAIDLKDGQVVRLIQGDFDKTTVYADDPAAMASRFMEQGARCLHVVDLDGAREGKSLNFDKIRDITALDGLFVQVGGGIRDQKGVEEYLALGVGRVILGTAAAEDFGFLEALVKKHGKRIAVAVDARDGRVAVRGWLSDSGLNAMEFCKKLEHAGVSTIIYTDISRDGLMQGPNLDAYRALKNALGCDIIASGGVSGAVDVAALREIGIYGVIIGKALYENTLRFSDLLKLC